mgnify:CR=1 FL=1
MKYRLGDLRVESHPTSWAAPNATLIGNVRLQANASVWFGAVLRGDNELIDIGEGSNVLFAGSVGQTGHNMGACATFLYNLRHGMFDIESGRSRVALVGGAEAPLYHDVVTRADIERMGVTSLEELFRLLPQTSSPTTSFQDAAENSVQEVAAGTNRSMGSTKNLMNCDATFLKSASKLGPVMLDVAQTATREQQQAAAAVLDEMRHKLHGILAGK